MVDNCFDLMSFILFMPLWTKCSMFAFFSKVHLHKHYLPNCLPWLCFLLIAYIYLNCLSVEESRVIYDCVHFSFGSAEIFTTVCLFVIWNSPILIIRFIISESLSLPCRFLGMSEWVDFIAYCWKCKICLCWGRD